MSMAAFSIFPANKILAELDAWIFSLAVWICESNLPDEEILISIRSALIYLALILADDVEDMITSADTTGASTCNEALDEAFNDFNFELA